MANFIGNIHSQKYIHTEEISPQSRNSAQMQFSKAYAND